MGGARRQRGESVEETSQSDWTTVAACQFSPAVFCFLMDGAKEGLACCPVATTTCDGTAIMAGAEEAVDAPTVGGATETDDFFTPFFGDSEEMGTLLSSYNFLFTVLFI